MANQRFSNRFLIVCLIAIIGLVLPNLVSSAVTPSVPGVSGEFNQPGPQKPKTGTGTSKAAVVYIITYDDIATDEQIQTFEQKLVLNSRCYIHYHYPHTTWNTHFPNYPLSPQEIDILYQYKELHGISVSMTAAQKKLIKDDPIIIGIKKDKEAKGVDYAPN
ncbi:hypothetical protein PSTT_09312 [Puccinia striiformis]|uniref:Inhibitor I9 domain-containing protein n=1 Tax=Puccinia striiformis TaxID=27350 RepID=A0A2S4V962_9BASI|nr:hypothetical protein PSTT_09312 [Puccinia striiformis]